jgi:hypothetical protein
VSLLGRFFAWRTRRRHAKHRAWLRKHRVVDVSPSPGCIVRNWREPHR